MRFLKGLLAMSGAGVALVIATIVLFVHKMRSTGAQVAGAQVADVKALWRMLSSPVYWLTVLALIGATVWLFRRWVLA